MFAASNQCLLEACPLHHATVRIPGVPDPAHWFSNAPCPPLPTAPVLLWLHGGYYLTGSAIMHAAPMTTWLKQHNTMAILSLEYTLTPDAAFPTALQQSATHGGNAAYVSTSDRSPRLPVAATAWAHPHPRRRQQRWRQPRAGRTAQHPGQDCTHKHHCDTRLATQALASPTPDTTDLAQLLVKDLQTQQLGQPTAALLVSPRVSSVGRYPPGANRRDLLSLRVLRGASLLHVGLPLPPELDGGMLQALTPAPMRLPGARAVLGLGEDAGEREVAEAVLQHPLLTPLHASAGALASLPPMLVTIGAYGWWRAGINNGMQGISKRMRQT